GWMEDEINACLALGHCHMSLHQEKHALLALTRSFCYDTPRAEACCRLGYLYKGRGDHVRALFWFDLALHLKKPEQSWGFTRDDDWGYVPMIESAVCHYALGDLDRAEECNDKAAQMKPNAPEVKHNQAFFASVRQVHEQS
ncbi:glycosyl transferase, partial [Eubacteriales bacterium OttesenSCG-928-N13]|nr:glycosyl transferase [Eubacteriales bacterium OttesenSCG-928-N13]